MGKKPWDEIKDELFRLQMFIASNEIMKTIPQDKLQDGTGSWTLNGVTISFDIGLIQETIEANDRVIRQMVIQLAPLIVGRSKIGFANTFLRTPGGNIIRGRR